MTDDVKSRLIDELGKEIFHLKGWICRYEDSDVLLGYKEEFEWLYEERKQLLVLLQDALTELNSRNAEIAALRERVRELEAFLMQVPKYWPGNGNSICDYCNTCSSRKKSRHASHCLAGKAEALLSDSQQSEGEL